MYLKWGPTTSPIEARLAKSFPKLTANGIKKLIAEYRDINFAAARIVVDQLESRQDEIAGRDRVAAIDPRLSAGNAATMYTQARVAAWRDGYS